MRRIIVLSLMVLVCLGAVIPGITAAKTTTLSFWTFQQFHVTFMEDAVKAWNKANPQKPIVLKAEVFGYDEMHNKLLIALQSGVGAPDLADIEISKFANYTKGKNPQLVSLNKALKPILEKCVISRFDNYAKDGQYFGIDYHVGATVMYYNKDYLDKAKVDADKIVTWDDYVEAGKKVMAATGKPMTTVEVTEHWTLYPMMIQNGSDIFAKDGKVILDNAENAKVLTFLRDMVHKHKIAIPAPGGFHHSEEYWAFMNKGGAASLMMPMWYMGRFTQYMPDLKGKMIIKPLPLWKKGGLQSAGMGGTGTVVTAQAKNKDLAVNFLVAAKASREGAIKTWTILGFDPIRWDVWGDPAMKADNEFTKYFGKDIFAMLLKIKDGIAPTVITEKYPLAIDLLKKNVSFKVIKEQTATPEQALKEAADELRKS